MKTAFVAFLLLLATPLTAGTTTTVLLVRHAEAVQGGDDPALTEAGAARAKALVDVARNAGVEVVLTTQYRRTKDTAAPLVEAAKIPMVSLDAKEPVATRILADYAGKTVLVVGHSNTIPAIVKELTGFEVPKIVHEDNSRLFIVTLGKEKRLVAAQYGCTP